MNFSIKIHPISQLGPDSERLGRITIGSFTEKFACYSVSAGSQVEQMERQWHAELRKLVAGEPAVVLPHDPRFGWVFYREGQDCYIQQFLFLDGKFDPPPVRCTTTDEGDRVSEWSTSLVAIQRFLAGDQLSPPSEF